MKPVAAPVRLIVGLGNPGPDYDQTRHNAGQDFVTQLADQLGSPLVTTPKFFGSSSHISTCGANLRLLVPSTYMNRSGQAVAAISKFYKIDTSEILVVHDELDLAPGLARLKVGGGHGGHNGLRDIISSLSNNKQFMRLRLGIGHPGHASAVSGYVLKKPPSDQASAIADAIAESLCVMPELLSGDWDKATRTLHTATPKRGQQAGAPSKKT